MKNIVKVMSMVLAVMMFSTNTINIFAAEDGHELTRGINSYSYATVADLQKVTSGTRLYGYEEKIIDVLDKFELIYPQEIAESMREDIQEKFKTVCYALALAVKENVSHLLYKMNRDKILSLYDECKLREQEYKNTDNEIISFTNYFYKSLKGQLLKSEGSSFFMPKNKNIESESFNSEEDEDEEER